MSKTVYIASRKRDQALVQTIRDKMANLGYRFSFDWTLEKDLNPYAKNQEEAELAALKMKRGAAECDIFILVWDDNLYGALIEFGIALGANTSETPKQMYIMAEDKQRVCIFEMLPEIEVVSSVDELIKSVH